MKNLPDASAVLLILAACAVVLVLLDLVVAGRRLRDDPYWVRVRARARELGSDGCTMGTGLFRDCCLDHDIGYRTGKAIDGELLTRADADERFIQCMQRRSIFGWWTPVGWVRYAVVRLVGWRAWKGQR